MNINQERTKVRNKYYGRLHSINKNDLRIMSEEINEMVGKYKSFINYINKFYGPNLASVSQLKQFTKNIIVNNKQINQFNVLIKNMPDVWTIMYELQLQKNTKKNFMQKQINILQKFKETFKIQFDEGKYMIKLGEKNLMANVWQFYEENKNLKSNIIKCNDPKNIIREKQNNPIYLSNNNLINQQMMEEKLNILEFQLDQNKIIQLRKTLDQKFFKKDKQKQLLKIITTNFIKFDTTKPNSSYIRNFCEYKNIISLGILKIKLQINKKKNLVEIINKNPDYLKCFNIKKHIELKKQQEQFVQIMFHQLQKIKQKKLTPNFFNYQLNLNQYLKKNMQALSYSLKLVNMTSKLQSFLIDDKTTQENYNQKFNNKIITISQKQSQSNVLEIFLYTQLNTSFISFNIEKMWKQLQINQTNALKVKNRSNSYDILYIFKLPETQKLGLFFQKKELLPIIMTYQVLKDNAARQYSVQWKKINFNTKKIQNFKQQSICQWAEKFNLIINVYQKLFNRQLDQNIKISKIKQQIIKKLLQISLQFQ